MVMDGKIGIIGAGPVGSILAAYLSDFGQDVVLVEEAPARYEHIKQNGLKIAHIANITARPAILLPSLADLSNYSMLALFVCTKTWALKKLLPELSKVVKPDTLVISFQNGIGPEDEFAKYIPAKQVVRGVVNFAGGISRDTGVVNMEWFTPPNILGPLTDDRISYLQAVCDIMNHTGLTTEVVNSYTIKKKAFFKTILNSALNAMCANSGVTMSQAMSYRHTRHLATILIREGLSVAAAVGYNYGEDAIETCMKYLDKGGDHLPSMWHDLQAQNCTEIEYINGKIAKIGLMFKNIDVDVNLFFTSMIITEEIKSGKRSPDDIPDYLTRL